MMLLLQLVPDRIGNIPFNWASQRKVQDMAHDFFMGSTHTYCGRFAPSPTGPLHFGSLIAALGSWLLARQAGGRWLVRIEDNDTPRVVSGIAQIQLETLKAFALPWDGEVIYQSARGARYQQILDSLVNRDLAFACQCSRADLGTDQGVHRGCVRPLDANQPNAWRLRVGAGTTRFSDSLFAEQSQQLAQEVGDFVLRRADGVWTYHLACVVDDQDQAITHIVRGADLLDSTPRQIYLQQQLGFRPMHYTHLPLAVDAAGRKLSKSEQSVAIEAGTAAATLKQAWSFLQQDPKILAGLRKPERIMQQALEHFRVEAIRKRKAPAPRPILRKTVR